MNAKRQRYACENKDGDEDNCTPCQNAVETDSHHEDQEVICVQITEDRPHNDVTTCNNCVHLPQQNVYQLQQQQMLYTEQLQFSYQNALENQKRNIVQSWRI